jgi:cation diffusion facilitator CzcD-associated flavoprotein CzcO
MDELSVAVIGGGFSGIGLAVRLDQAGIRNFAVLERGDGVGGTWHFNTYPGCACDVPSHLYSFSFAPNPGWSHTYSRQPEIRDYLRRVVDDFGVAPRIRLGCEVRSARWDGAGWEIDTSQGPLRARVLVSAAGFLVEPRIPPLPGLDAFAGPAFHSARWDHSADLSGRRVAVVGTGASAIQFVPAIAPHVARLHVFQRTAPWVVPHSSRPITRAEQRLLARVPLAQRLVRGGIYAGRELLVLGFVKQPRLMRRLERLAEQHMRRAIADPALLAEVRPDYTIGCKRILPSNDWYPALARDNVELVTDPIAEVRERAIVTADGAARAVDAIVFGTGFQVVDLPFARLVRGRDGRTLAEAWQGSPRAHLGTAVAGFPNLFILLGPNTGLGHSSMVYMIESQIAYVIGALRELRRNGHRSLEVRPDVQERFNREVQRRLRGTVWSTGCRSWYLDEHGTNTTLWPDWTWRFRRRTARFDPAEYVLTA